MALLLYRVGRFAYLNRFKVIAIWLLALIGISIAALALSKPTNDDFSLPGLPSERATNLLQTQFGGEGGDVFTAANATFVFQAKDGTLADPKNAEAVDAVIADIRTQFSGTPELDADYQLQNPNLLQNPAVKTPIDPATLTDAQRAQLTKAQQQAATIASTTTPEQQKADAAVLAPVNQDGTVAKLQLSFGQKVTDLPGDTAEKLNDAAQVGRDAGLKVEIDGSAAKGMEPMGMSSELIGMLVAAVVLIITFASLVAWGLPLINAIIAVPIALMGVMLATHFTEVGTFPSILTSMIGLAVTIDYALFIVSRYRHELRRLGASTREERAEAAGIAIGTAGSAVVFAGLTVIVALAALAFIGISFLGQMGIAAAWGVFVAVLVALTLLPALLGLFGSKAFAGRVRGLHPQDTDQGQGRVANGERWARIIHKAPVVVLVAGVALLGILAIPIKDMATALPSSGMSDPASSSRQAYDMVSDGFGAGANGRLLVVADGTGIDSPEQRLNAYAAFVRTLNQAEGDFGDIANAQITSLAPDNRAAQIVVTPKTGPNDAATHDLVQAIRDAETGPGGAQEALNIEYGVAGQAAVEMDVSDKLADALPKYLLIVVGLAFVLLLIAFRSILVPLTAALGFLLSVVATFGITSAVFTDGALGLIDNTQPLVSFLPIFLIGIVFGLAMDYQVFLVSRMREEYVHRGDAKEAVVVGVKYGARVVTAAAIIMISVFAAFIMNKEVFVKEIGFGLAVAVLFDAFVVRLVIIPAVMTLLGKTAWWLPKWLDKIVPNVDIEGERLVTELAARGVGAPKAAEQASEASASVQDSASVHDTAEVPVSTGAPTGPVRVGSAVRAPASTTIALPVNGAAAQPTSAADPVADEHPTAPVPLVQRRPAPIAARREIDELKASNKVMAAELNALKSDYRSITARARLERELVTDPTSFAVEARLEGPDGPLGRAGRLITPHGEIATPAFIPVGTKATVKTVMPEAVRDLGAQAVLANAYHLYLQPGPEIVEQAGGLGAFMNWDGPTFTDSGGFQVMSLGSGYKKVISMTADSIAADDDAIAEGKERLSRVDDDGVTFRSHLDGREHRFTPEVSMQIQHSLGADVIFAFDELTTLMNTRGYQETSLERTRLWARRCLAEHNWLTAQRGDRQSLWGVVQGAQYEDLRRKAARDLRALSEEDTATGGLGFGGYGIGGALAKEQMSTIVRWVNQELGEDKPKHLLGISEPDDIFAAVEQGVDTFDCVSPSRVARNGAIYSLDGRYNVTNAKYRADFRPLDPGTQNYTTQFTRAYIHHLFRAKESLAATLATIHNEQFIVSLVARIRESMLDGTYWDFKTEFLGRYYSGTKSQATASE